MGFCAADTKGHMGMFAIYADTDILIIFIFGKIHVRCVFVWWNLSINGCEFMLCNSDCCNSFALIIILKVFFV